ncbi:MAG: protease inhibitor I42 family protein, partial [Actinomycetota bacterium]|nr:protease inhibitor I42 family protein [Actinomycetota bacterium]
MRSLVRLTSMFLAAVGLAIGTLAAGAPANAQANSTGEVTLTVTELPGQVRLLPGEKIELTLQTNRTTGYQWSASTTGKKKAIKVSKGEYTPS